MAVMLILLALLISDLIISGVVLLAGAALIAYAYSTHKKITEPPKMTPVIHDDAFYQRVSAQITAIEAEMKRIGFWQNEPLQPEQYNFRVAFAGDTMAFPQWLQFVFIPNVRRIIDTHGTFPTSSQVSAYAVREFDTYREDTGQLITLLHDFDRMF
jgi:uncharacterized protein YqcC (DUF446 family)